MRSSRLFWLWSLCALSALPLAGCGSGSGSTSHPTPSQTVQLTVNPAPTAGQATITSNPSGINCPTTCTASFDSGTKVTLTVTPGTSYLFTGWGGACSGMNCTLTLTSAETVSANFVAGDGITVALSGNGTGTVTSNPSGINCPTTCSSTFPKGTTVVLTETAGPTFYFGGWTGCTGTTTCSVTVNAAENITASFTAGDAVTVTTTGTGTGSVSSNPAGISCSSGSATGCSVTFAPGANVTLTETPSSGDIFSGWSGACSGTAGCSLTLSSASTAVTAGFAPPGTIASLQHIILFAQENRSLDHYFGAMMPYWQSIGLHQSDGVTFNGLPQFNPGGTAPVVSGCAAGTWGGSCSPTSSDPITSFHLQSSCMENQSPFWNEAHNQWDYADPTGSNPNDLNNPPLDGFAFTAAYDADGNGFMDIEGVRAMGYYDSTDLNYYYFLASMFATSDSWFAPIMSRTQLNRMYMIGATSNGHAYPLHPPENPIPSTPIFEQLQNAGISWKIYVDPTGTPCDGMTGSQLSSCLLENASYLNEFSYESTVLNNPTLLANIQPISTYTSDVAAGTLPSFALIEPASSAGDDEHPSDSDAYAVNVQDGMKFVADTVINPLMQSSSWSTSALIFTYDEWGGTYDHVPPQPATAPGDGPYDQGDPAYPTDLVSGDICSGQGQLGTGMCSFSWTGFRVPVVVISPFAKMNYVSHTVRDTTSVLNLVEERFGLKPLTNRDASQPLMDEFFNFANPPWPDPPTPPTPATGLICDQTPPSGPYSPGGGWGEPPQLSVAVKSGSGTITSSPAGISCSTDFTFSGFDVCGYVFTDGTQVTLTETPGSGTTFTGWSAGTNNGPCSGTSPTCTFTMSQGDAEYVQASFQ